MLKRFSFGKKIVSRNFRGILFRQFSTEGDQCPSYFHRLGLDPLKYMTVGQLLKKTATKYPDRLALISFCENSQLSFAEALDKADRFAIGLLNLGLSRGDRVAIWAPNYQFWYVSMLAIARAGLVCVGLNPAYQIPEVDYSIKKVDVKAIIIPEEFRTQKYYEMLTSLVPSMKHSKSQIEDNQANTLRHVIVVSEKTLPGTIKFDDLLIVSPESDVAEIEKMQSSIQPDDGCNLQFTSGTTGQSKAAFISHFIIVNSAHGIALRMEQLRQHRHVCSLFPLFHMAGVLAIFNSMFNGWTVVLPSPHFSAELSLKTLSKLRCQCLYGTPSMYVDMIAKQKELRLDLPDIQVSFTGAAIVTPKLVEDGRKYLRIKNFTTGYGMTETAASGFQSLPGEDSDLVIDHVGHVADHTEVKIIDKDGKTVPFGQPGELCVRGYCNMLGYWKDPVKTAEVLGDDKWLKTGDQFILYPNGYGKIVGRLKEMIIRGGENIFPREIEDFLNNHPNILEVHVIGIPDKRMGEEVGAFIRLKDPSKPFSAEEVKSFCKGKLAHFKIPRYIFVVDNFPKTASGKVQKIKFLEFFADKLKLLQ